MRTAIKVTKQTTINDAERFLGSGTRAVSMSKIEVSAVIAAHKYAVVLPDNATQEDRGLLSLYPVDDNRYCLQLSYLEVSDTSDTEGLVYILRYMPDFFTAFPPETLMANQPFRFDQTTEQQFSVCGQARELLAALDAAPIALPTLFVSALQRTELAMHLLRRALECIVAPFTTCQVPACRFLAYEGERDKIMMAMSIIRQSLDQPHTIKELSRKVAMNECYLKKGFKALAGKTIHEYQQELRIDMARKLLQEQGRSVTDVANTLGFSSISHFSTAFKKVTGLKPCDLLS